MDDSKKHGRFATATFTNPPPSGLMLIISNPHAGDKKGSQFLKEIVVPLLGRHASSIPVASEETTASGQAGAIASNYLKRISGGDVQEDPIMVISGGDTTIHEVVNGIAGLKQTASVIIVPSGTANALYHSLFPPKERDAFVQQLPSTLREEADSVDGGTQSKLYGVFSFLSRGPTKRLYSTRTTIEDSSTTVVRTILSCVVVSASLHASILDVAESLRSTHPGIERFKIAAGQSITQWSDALLVVKYPYQVYDVHQGVFHTLESPEPSGVEEFGGPFAYFLTTTNVDRLEEHFRVTPLSTSIQFTDDAIDKGWMEVLMVRPQQASSGPVGESEASRKEFATSTMKVLQAAYNDGSHVNRPEENAKTLIEYLRVREWEWIPDKESSPAHLVCVDGEVLHIPAGGKAKVELLCKEDRPELSVYGSSRP